MQDSDELKPKDKKSLLLRVRECFKDAKEDDGDMRRRALADIKFANSTDAHGQWDQQSVLDRGKDRLMLQFNKVNIQCKRIINEMRANRPSSKVRGTEDSDKDTAEVIEGLIRNIRNNSDVDTISDYQAEYQVKGGFGCWRVSTKYAKNSVDQQDIVIENIPNPFCVWSDPNAMDILKRDADWWIVTEMISKKAFKAKYGKAKQVSFEDSEFEQDSDWDDDDRVRICEFWYKEPATKELALLVDGRTVDTAVYNPPPEMIVKSRQVQCDKIKMAICSGDDVLEGPFDWPGEMFPFVPVYGEYLVIDGKPVWNGLVKDLKDAQRAYNSHRTAIVETIESAPQSKVWATATQAEGHVKAWQESHKKNFFFNLYNPDPQAPGPPIRIGGAEVPMALIQATQIASEEINSLAGFVFDPSGNEAQNISGKALNARSRQGAIATFNYPDNMGKAHKLTDEIIIDLLPKIYDTARSVRILGADGAEKYVKVNQPDENGVVMNDLSRGKYDVVVTTGPSFATQRQEAAEAFIALAGQDQMLMPTAGDLVYKAMDLPYSEQIAERRQAMLPPPIQEMINSDKPLPPEVQQAMMQVQQQAEQVKQHGMLVQQAQSELQSEKADADKAKSSVEIAMANLKAEEARFEATVAKAEAKLQKLAADLSVQEIQNESDKADAEKVGNAANFAIQQIQAVADGIKSEFGQFLGHAAQVVIAAKEQPPIVLEKPRAVRIRSKRVNGEQVGTIEYDDGTHKQVKASRLNGELVANVQPDAAIAAPESQLTQE